LGAQNRRLIDPDEVVNKRRTKLVISPCLPFGEDLGQPTRAFAVGTGADRARELCGADALRRWLVSRGVVEGARTRLEGLVLARRCVEGGYEAVGDAGVKLRLGRAVLAAVDYVQAFGVVLKAG
jgi:hypothetical protein